MNENDGFIKIIDDTGELLREALSRSNKSVLSAWEEKYANGILKFSDKEISKMPKEFKKEFRSGNLVAHVRKKANGVFEIRCQINKTKIAVSSKLLDTAKEKFLKALSDLTQIPIAQKVDKKVKLCDYMLEWLETVKKPLVKAVTYKDYLLSLNSNIRPVFESRELASVKGFELQTFITGFTESGRNRTAKKLYQLLTSVFDYAVTDDIITKSPMQRVVLARYEQEQGVPLTRQEESAFMKSFVASASIHTQAFAFMLYTGIRRSELASVTVSDGWVTVHTSKQRKGFKAKLRAVPISPMLARILPQIDVEAIKAISPNVLTKQFKKVFPKHHLHDLRHTFITRAQECGIPRELVSLWAGHAADTSTTSLVYTHLEQNREHQEIEIKKFDYPLI